MIEVELRGRLTVSARKRVLLYALKNGKFVREVHQLTIFCETGNKAFGSFYDTKVRIGLQLSQNLLTKKRTLQLKLKDGHWERGSRPETVLTLSPNELPEAYRIFRALGLHSGCPRFYHRWDYQFDDVTLSLKNGGLAPDHWELEMLAQKEKDSSSIEKKLKVFAKRLGLTPWSESEYRSIIEKVYRENPPIAFEAINVKSVFI